MNLLQILEAFNAAINEEQAWAICHQHARRVLDIKAADYSDGAVMPYVLPSGLESIVLSKDGLVTVVDEEETGTEKELVDTFGRVLYDALDYGIDDDEEQVLSSELERLIERMTLNYDGVLLEEDDEGYDAEDEIESPDHGPCTLKVVVKLCEEHLEEPSKANEHYGAVCRALLSEALDLKVFLEKVAYDGELLRDINDNNNNNAVVSNSDDDSVPRLHFTDWAQLWIQVVEDLRFGVKLKKVEGYTRNVEYELTPYEILMRDIRQRKYTLKKVAVNGEIPLRVKHNAHDVILDFIKSRPSLKPIEDRKLRPLPPRSKSLHELLLEQIQDRPTALRHVEPPEDSPIRKRRAMEAEHAALSASKSYDLSKCQGTPVKNPEPIRSAPQRRRLAAPRLDEFADDLDSTSDSEPDSEDESSFAIDSILTDLSTTANESMSPFKRNSFTSSMRSSGTSGVSSNECDEVDALPSERVGRFIRHTTTVREKRVLPFDPVASPIYSSVPDTSTDTVPPLVSYSTAARQTGIRRTASMNKNPTTDTVPPLVCYSSATRQTGIRRANSMNTVRATVLTGNRDVFRRPVSQHDPLAWRQRLQRHGAFPSSESITLPPTNKFTSPPLVRRAQQLDLVPGNAPKRGIRRAMSERRPDNSSPQVLSNKCSLTVEELMHIRHVLARAELEKYMTQKELYNNLKKGKICFNCRIRKFSVFCWSSTCEICKQKICSKCMRKVRAPTDEPLLTPVHALCPSLNSSAGDVRNHLRVPQGADQDADSLAERLSSATTSYSSTVLRDFGLGSSSLATPQSSELDYVSGSTKTRKMDVCEECCDLIVRITQANRSADSSPVKGHRYYNTNGDAQRHLVWRSSPQTARAAGGLRRSTSSAAAWRSCIPATSARQNVHATRSVQNFQAFAS